jgi:hypothetical protein
VRPLLCAQEPDEGPRFVSVVLPVLARVQTREVRAGWFLLDASCLATVFWLA